MSSGLSCLNNFHISLNVKRERGTLLPMHYLEDMHYFLLLKLKFLDLKLWGTCTCMMLNLC